MTERFTIMSTPLAGLCVVERRRVVDERGFFSRLFCAEELAAAGFERPVAQINHTFTRRAGAVRGLHFQHPPHAEDKFVSCLRGEIFDAAVDLRRNSPTFLTWHGVTLSESNSRSLFIPRGFAHGFQTLTDDCELIYLHTESYAAGAEGGLSPLDPALSIQWPLPITELSARDSAHPNLSPEFSGVAI